VFTVDVLLAWALVGLWLLVREPLVGLLPRALQARPAALLRCGTPRARVRPSLVARWYLSAVLGALTHVVWDAFTHLDRWGIGGSPRYWCMQYGGSAVAAVLIALFVARALRRMPPGGTAAGVPLLSAPDRWAAVALLGGCALAGAVQRASRWWAHWGASAKPCEIIPTVCFGAGAAIIVALPLLAVAVRGWRRPAPAIPAAGTPGAEARSRTAAH